MKDEGFFFGQKQMGINPGHKALGGRFFISGGTIDLAGQKEVLNQFGA